MEKNCILQGDCVRILQTLPDQSVDLIFADPPYFMQTEGELLRTNGEKFSGVEDPWDQFESFTHYDAFCKAWLTECQRLLKDSGSIWVIGSFQNIFRLGYIMQNLGFWIINDVIWAKPNPVPNFKGTRFCNAHETLIWCAKSKHAKYTFNYKTMKWLNHNKQERSIWHIGICIGSERLKDEQGKKVHSTQKPEALLEKVILSSTKTGDIVLDPFFGTGTTGAMAKKFGRHFIGIEQNERYIQIARRRIEQIAVVHNDISLGKLETKPPRVSLSQLQRAGLLQSRQKLYDQHQNYICTLQDDNRVFDGQETLSIHKMAAKHLHKSNHNGWDYFYILHNRHLVSLNQLRHDYAQQLMIGIQTHPN